MRDRRPGRLPRPGRLRPPGDGRRRAPSCRPTSSTRSARSTASPASPATGCATSSRTARSTTPRWSTSGRPTRSPTRSRPTPADLPLLGLPGSALRAAAAARLGRRSSPRRSPTGPTPPTAGCVPRIAARRRAHRPGRGRRPGAARWSTTGAAQSLCLHGDTPGAVELARRVRGRAGRGRRGRAPVQLTAMRVLPYGDRAVLVEVDGPPVALRAALAASRSPAIDELVPAARTVLVRFDPRPDRARPRSAAAIDGRRGRSTAGADRDRRRLVTLAGALRRRRPGRRRRARPAARSTRSIAPPPRGRVHGRVLRLRARLRLPHRPRPDACRCRGSTTPAHRGAGRLGRDRRRVHRGLPARRPPAAGGCSGAPTRRCGISTRPEPALLTPGTRVRFEAAAMIEIVRTGGPARRSRTSAGPATPTSASAGPARPTAARCGWPTGSSATRPGAAAIEMTLGGLAFVARPGGDGRR